MQPMLGGKVGLLEANSTSGRKRTGCKTSSFSFFCTHLWCSCLILFSRKWSEKHFCPHCMLKCEGDRPTVR